MAGRWLAREYSIPIHRCHNLHCTHFVLYILMQIHWLSRHNYNQRLQALSDSLQQLASRSSCWWTFRVSRLSVEMFHPFLYPCCRWCLLPPIWTRWNRLLTTVVDLLELRSSIVQNQILMPRLPLQFPEFSIVPWTSIGALLRASWTLFVLPLLGQAVLLFVLCISFGFRVRLDSFWAS